MSNHQKKTSWRDNIGSASGPLASVYWCKLCDGRYHQATFKVTIYNGRGRIASSKAMASVQRHIKAEHQDTPVMKKTATNLE